MRLALSGLSLALALACSGDGGSSGNNPYDPGGGGGGGGGNPAPNTVTVGNDFFNPVQLNLSGGGTVTWSWNSGGVTHNVTFEDGQGSSGNQTSGTHQRTFSTSTATHKYRCTIHSTSYDDGMVGRVVVP